MKSLSGEKATHAFLEFLQQAQQRIERVLQCYLNELDYASADLQAAMAYSVLNGGKRLRPAVVYSVEDELGLDPVVSDHIATAIEFMHVSSLIHDDLPGLDNDDLRRGKASCHVAYNEALAVLAGDALLNLSHHALLQIPRDKLSAACCLELLRTLNTTIGTMGMMGGQALEFPVTMAAVDCSTVKTLYHLKTGCLLASGLQMAVLASTKIQDQNKPTLTQSMYDYGRYVGIAFQIQDDLLEVTSDSATIGKSAESDKTNGRQTYVQLVGLEQARQDLSHYQQLAKDSLQSTGYPLTILQDLTDYMVKRTS